MRRFQSRYVEKYSARVDAIIEASFPSASEDSPSSMARDLVRATSLAKAESRRPGCPAYLRDDQRPAEEEEEAGAELGLDDDVENDFADMNSSMDDGSITRIVCTTPAKSALKNGRRRDSSPLSPSIFSFYSGRTPIGGASAAAAAEKPLSPLDSVSPIAFATQSQEVGSGSFDASQEEEEDYEIDEADDPDDLEEEEEEEDLAEETTDDGGTLDGIAAASPPPRRRVAQPATAASRRHRCSAANPHSAPLKVTLRPFQAEGLEWMVARESSASDNPARGGILALDMGLGKAVISIALIHGAARAAATSRAAAVRSSSSSKAPEPSFRGVPGPTIIVVPVALVQQWGNELARKAPSLKVCLFHGPRKQRPCDPIFIASFDVVVTSYGILASRDVTASRQQRRLCRIASTNARAAAAASAAQGLSPAWIRTNDETGSATVRYHERWRRAEREDEGVVGGGGMGGMGSAGRGGGLFETSFDEIEDDEDEDDAEAEAEADYAARRRGGARRAGARRGRGGGSSRAAAAAAANESKTLSLLHMVEWGRIILDEAHLIANPATQRSVATRMLVATARWCLTGTPVQRHARDASSLVRFIQGRETRHLLDLTLTPARVKPSEKPFAAYALKPLLRALLLRRTHESLGGGAVAAAARAQLDAASDESDVSTSGGEDVLLSLASASATASAPRTSASSQSTVASGRGNRGSSSSSVRPYIPPLPLMRERTETLRWSNVNEHARFETSLYSWLERCARAVHEHTLETAVQPPEWSLKLRQACCHPRLVRQLLAKFVGEAHEESSSSEEESETTDEEEPATQLQDTSVVVRRPLSLRAEGRRLLRTLDQLERAASQGLSPRVAAFDGAAPEGGGESGARAAKERRARARQHRCRSWASLKIRGLARSLAAAEAEASAATECSGEFKVIIFSQWPSFLRIVDDVLSGHGWSCAQYDGSSSATERERVLARFRRSSRDKRSASVLLLAMDSGGFGLNLQGASHVFLADVALSLAKEQQAIGRARRIGRDEMQILSVVRFLTHSTVEETIKHDVQRRKNDAASAALRGSEAQRPGDPDYLTGSILARLFAADG